MKLEVEQGNERRVQEAAKMIKAYCELLTDKEYSTLEKTNVPQVKRALPSSSVTTTTSTVHHTSKDEGSLLDF